MKSKLTMKDNFLRLLRNEMPESVPIHTMGIMENHGESPYKLVGPFLFDETRLVPVPGGYTDIWGVRLVTNKETGFGCIPEPGNFILKDITKWRDVIKRPEMPEHIDWEAMARKDEKVFNWNPEKNARMGVIGMMPFQSLMEFMGFNEGLLAMAEEPEECFTLLDYMADLYVPIVEAAVNYYDLDCIYLLDDTATKYNPFISVDMYREILKPIYIKLTKPAVDRGIPVQFHNCGRCEAFIPDMLDFGVKILEPLQTQNHLDDIKKTYAGKLIMAGCYDWNPPVDWPHVDEEKIRQEVRDMVDRFAPGGGYIASAGSIAAAGDEVMAKVNMWCADELYHYCQDYYIR